MVLTDFVFALAFLLCTYFFCCSIVKFQCLAPSLRIISVLLRACLLYHFIPCLSIGFLKLFLVFFNLFSRCLKAICFSLPSTATRLLYHIHLLLSTLFLKVFYLFLLLCNSFKSSDHLVFSMFKLHNFQTLNVIFSVIKPSKLFILYIKIQI